MKIDKHLEFGISANTNEYHEEIQNEGDWLQGDIFHLLTVRILFFTKASVKFTFCKIIFGAQVMQNNLIY